MQGDVHVYAPAPLDTRILWRRCYGCADTKRSEKRSPMLVRFFEWFDPEATCLRCGESLGHERPWSPAWRKKSRVWALRVAARLGLRIPKTIAREELPDV